jgi:uncharacterized protein (DUF433 family)
MSSTVISLRVSKDQAARLQRKARHLGCSPSETGALLLEECLRRDEFAFIDFRDSAVGRQAYIQGTRLAVWMVVKIARTYGGDANQAAEHLQRSPMQVQAALNYAKAFPQEIEAAIQDHDSYDFGKTSRSLPQARLFQTTGKKAPQK